jgi:glycerol-3-phosphate acyltransferase PlsY
LSLCPLFTYAFISSDAAIPLCMLAIIVIYRHRANVLRLWQGTESKIGTKKKA